MKALKWQTIRSITSHKVSNILMLFSFTPILYYLIELDGTPTWAINILIKLENYAVGLTFIALSILLSRLLIPSLISEHKLASEYVENCFSLLDKNKKIDLLNILQNKNILLGYNPDTEDNSLGLEYYNYINNSRLFYKYLVIGVFSLGFIIISLNYINNILILFVKWNQHTLTPLLVNISDYFS